MEDFLQVGVITATHGIRGEVKVFPTTDDPERFLDLETVYLDTGREKKLLTISSVKFFKQFVILKFKEFDNINDVDEYFIADLIGLRVITDEDKVLGELTDVLETGANDVYQVTDENGKEILLPAIKDCILSVDLEKGEMKVHILEGLLDL